ncbi:MAG: hypothetical protein GWO24_20065, partial [Akkermansiaceae bacterium]|nr:hypothetical protein [Akkermansiaceae bacterium]
MLAIIGDHRIRTADLEHEWKRRATLGRPLESKEALLDDMVRDEILVQAALRAGLEQDPEVSRAIRALLIGTLKEKELTPQLTEL